MQNMGKLLTFRLKYCIHAQSHMRLHNKTACNLQSYCVLLIIEH